MTTENTLNLKGSKRYYAIGETIIKEGDPSEGWFVLLHGRVGVYKKDLSVTELQHRGTVFGELGCILKKPRTATIVALEATAVLFVQMDIDEVIKNHPDLTKRILVGLAERLAQTTESWWASVELAEA